MNFAKQLRSMRLQKSIRISELADALGVSPHAISDWENGVCLPETRLLPHIAMLFGATIDELFGFSDDELLERLSHQDWNSRHMDDFTFRRHADYLARKCAAEPYNARIRIIAAQLYNHRARADREKAASSAREALEIMPGERTAWSELISAMGGKRGDEWQDDNFSFIEYLMGFVGVHADNHIALRLLVENLMADGRYDEAEPFVGELESIADAEYLCRMYEGDIALARGNRRDAMRKWEAAAEESGCDWRVHGEFARRLRRLGLFNRALIEYDKTYTLQPAPRLLAPLSARAMIFEHLGCCDDAIAERRRIIADLAQNYGITEGAAVDEQLREIERLNKMK
jgi:transcriptional regulator with XRE-family HTH domain